MGKKQTILVDFNGVLDMYTGWKGKQHSHPPRPGVREFLQALRDRQFRVVVFTSREAGFVDEWLEEFGLRDLVDEITNKKLPAFAIIDDRAITFNGSFDDALATLATFGPHWKSTPPSSNIAHAEDTRP